jgi:hypothetical protein
MKLLFGLYVVETEPKEKEARSRKSGLGWRQLYGKNPVLKPGRNQNHSVLHSIEKRSSFRKRIQKTPFHTLTNICRNRAVLRFSREPGQPGARLMNRKRLFPFLKTGKAGVPRLFTFGRAEEVPDTVQCFERAWLFLHLNMSFSSVKLQSILEFFPILMQE